jgi:hypothetical protein
MHQGDSGEAVGGSVEAATASLGGRRAAVARAAKAWTGQLIDLGGRNNLLYYRDLRRGMLELTKADARAFADLLHGKRVRGVLRVRRIRPETRP